MIIHHRAHFLQKVQQTNYMNKAFTLAEIMIVMAIILLLGSLLLPAIAGAYDSALRIACTNNMHQMSVCSMLYAKEHRNRLPAEGNKGIKDPKKSRAWFYCLPPYADAEDVQTRNSVFQCPGCEIADPHIFNHASPKSYKMNGYLDNKNRSKTYRLGLLKDESSIILFIDAVAGETGMGQWGHAARSAVTDEWHPGAINVLYLDGHSQKIIDTPENIAEDGWGELLKWESRYWR
jgi:prepilin-type N-terminal cleavage/methylation domain-containing protein/prepilin-type processing-associated H-X9-DG protein